jgi:hypothetical protein
MMQIYFRAVFYLSFWIAIQKANLAYGMISSQRLNKMKNMIIFDLCLTGYVIYASLFFIKQNLKTKNKKANSLIA